VGVEFAGYDYGIRDSSISEISPCGKKIEGEECLKRRGQWESRFLPSSAL